MVCFSDYELIVPKNNLERFTQYVLKGIYGFRDKDLWFLPSYVEPESESDRWRCIKLSEETDQHFKITFRICTFSALMNVMPPIKINSSTTFFSDRIVFDAAKERLWGMVSSARDDMGRIYDDTFNLAPEDRRSLVRQLAKEGDISSWLELDDGNFICRAAGVPIYIGSEDGLLSVHLMHRGVTFDFDDGCCFDNSKEIQSVFLDWKQRGDITKPIFPEIVI